MSDLSRYPVDKETGEHYCEACSCTVTEENAHTYGDVVNDDKCRQCADRWYEEPWII